MIKNWFNLKELLNYAVAEGDIIGFLNMLNKFETLNDEDIHDKALESAGITANDLRGYLMETGNPVDTRPISRLLFALRLRFQNHYIGGYIVTPENRDVADEYEVMYKSKDMHDFIDKFIAILCATKSKYQTILNIYSSQENKLMDGLKTQRDGSNALDRAHSDHSEHGEGKSEDYTIQADGVNLHNDTPQTTDVVATMEQDQFVSDLDKSSATTHNLGSSRVDSGDDSSGEVHDRGETHESSTMDTKYVMGKIAEIQDSYQIVLTKWTDEFGCLFIEEENLL